MAHLPDDYPVERLRAAREEDQRGDRRLGGRDARGDRAAETVTEQKHTVPGHGRVLPEELDRRDRVRQVLVGEGEIVSVLQLVCVCVGDLVEPNRRDAAAGQPPRDVP